jgi:hypothetical protein
MAHKPSSIAMQFLCNFDMTYLGNCWIDFDMTTQSLEIGMAFSWH